MNGKLKYVLMGLFVLVLSFTLVAVVLWLSAGNTGREFDQYLVYMQDSVSGLSRDNVVKYQGVDVGRVREIGFDPDHVGSVRLLLQIDRGTPIRQDTVATLEAQGLTGLAYINLTGGSAESPLLTRSTDDALPVIPSRPSVWGRLDVAVEQLVIELTDVSRLFKLLLREQNQDRISRILQQLDQFTGALAGRSETLVETVDDLAATVQQTRSASADLPALLDRLKRSAVALERMADEVRNTGASFREVVVARDRDLQKFTTGVLPGSGAIIDELRQAAANLRRFSEQLERDPSVLLRGRRPRPAGPGE